MEAKFLLLFAGVIAALVALRILAAPQGHIIGRIFRWYWNTSFKLAAFIPLCGWMAHFIIGPEKLKYVDIGKQSDERAIKAINDAAERERREREREEAVRAAIAQQFGGTDVSLNGDGSAAKYQDSKGRTHEVKIYYRK